MSDQLASNAPTWTRGVRLEPVTQHVQDIPASVTILEAPEQWRAFADREEKRNPTLAASYRHLAESVERYLSIRSGGRD